MEIQQDVVLYPLQTLRTAPEVRAAVERRKHGRIKRKADRDMEPLSKKMQKVLAKFLADRGIDVVEEARLPNRRRIDIAGKYKVSGEKMSIGIEIKSSLADLKTGYGLNFGIFDYEYLVLLDPSEALIERTIGYLFLKGYRDVGILILVHDKNGKLGLWLAKDAGYCPKKNENPAYYFLSSPIALMAAGQ